MTIEDETGVANLVIFQNLFEQFRKPVVIDADALNIISRSPSLQKKIPGSSVLTPHTREFDRLFGDFEGDFDRVDTALAKAKELNVIIVLKGAHTFIATPGGMGHFNSTGNPGMATAGMGDVLAGVITSLLCQGYAPEHAALLGVYVHGLAGDIAASQTSQQSLIASDVIEYLGAAFKTLQ